MILDFLLANWKWIAVGLVIASLAGYIETIKVERNHYKKEYEQLQLKFDVLKKQDDQLTAENEAITTKYKDTLKTANTLVTENARINAQSIAKDKELAAIKLSFNAVRVFNASKQPTTEESKPTETKPRDDGKASTSQVPTASLADLLLVTNENDANHLKCIKQVEQWQQFWKDYTAAVEANNAQ